jgi:hypothetical protein
MSKRSTGTPKKFTERYQITADLKPFSWWKTLTCTRKTEIITARLDLRSCRYGVAFARFLAVINFLLGARSMLFSGAGVYVFFAGANNGS